VLLLVASTSEIFEKYSACVSGLIGEPRTQELAAEELEHCLHGRYSEHFFFEILHRLQATEVLFRFAIWRALRRSLEDTPLGLMTILALHALNEGYAINSPNKLCVSGEARPKSQWFKKYSFLCTCKFYVYVHASWYVPCLSENLALLYPGPEPEFRPGPLRTGKLWRQIITAVLVRVSTMPQYSFSCRFQRC
jgi:hypothetical protein